VNRRGDADGKCKRKELLMKNRNRVLAYSLGAMLSGTSFASAAFAGCGSQPIHKSAFLTHTGEVAGLVQLASFDSKSIVGLWSVTFVSQGTQIDFGYSEWHSDGTEILNSGSRAPATENFCLGVWKQVGVNAYSLNHWALSYDMGGNLNAKVNIKERVKVAHGGDAMEGTFSIQAYDPNTGDPIGPETDGNIAGTRVTVD
jgi:hypothetical protein